LTASDRGILEDKEIKVEKAEGVRERDEERERERENNNSERRARK
jgi:hypothetical protein